VTDFLTDSFTASDGTALESHTPDVGSTWTTQNDTGILHITTDQLWNSFGASDVGLNPATPASADYDVECIIGAPNAGCGWFGGVAGRMVGFGQWYGAGWDSSSSLWTLYLANSGLGTLGTSGSSPLTTTRDLLLHMSGSTIELWVDGVPLISVSDSTFPSAGNAGVFGFYGCGSNYYLDSLRAGPPSGTPETVHAVSGAGSFTLVTEASYLAVAVTGIPSGAGQGIMDPSNYWKLGLVSWGTANGEMGPRQVIFADSLIEIPDGMTTVWYGFYPGISATITELLTP